MSIAQTFPNGLRVLQVVGAMTIAERKRILLADQPGAGKTAQALVAAELAGLFDRPSKILVLCNVTGCQLTWAPEISNRVMGQHDIVFADLTDTRGRKTMPSVAKRNDQLGSAMIEASDLELPLVVLGNFDLVRWKFNAKPKLENLWNIDFDMVIIDEAHLVLPTREDAKQKVTQFWYGLNNLSIKPDAIRLPMSGTPDRSKLENRYGHWKFLHPTSHTSFWSWAQAHFVVDYVERGYNPRTHRPIMVAEVGKLRNADAWAAYERQHMIRRTKAEMLEGLPEKQWAGEGGIDLPMTPAQEQAYFDYMDYLDNQRTEMLALGTDEAFNKASAMRMQFKLRARQMATCTWNFIETVDDGGHVHTHGVPIIAGPDKSNKLAWLLDWLESRGYTKENWDPTLGKVVIVSYFTEVLSWLKAELEAAGISAAVMSGDTSAPDKKLLEQAFQAGDLRVILLSGFLGVSITLDAADDMIFIDQVEDADVMEQVEDRIHRASRNHQVTFWRLVSMDTADVVVLQAADHRYRETRTMYEGSRGVLFARRMLTKIGSGS